MTKSLVVPPSGAVQAHSFRLHPNESIKESLCATAQILFSRMPEDECSSLFIMTAVGSLKDVTLRLANASKKTGAADDGDESDPPQQKLTENDIKRWPEQRFEIVGLVGTFSRDGSCHLHLCISDAEGNTFGGHLMAGVVFTTVECVLGSIQGVEFAREIDSETGYKEIVPKQILRDEGWFKLPGCTEIAKAAFWILAGISLQTYVAKTSRR